MARWIAFDQETAAELRSHLPQESVFEAPGRAALEYALNTSRPVVALLAPEVGDEVTLAVFRATQSEEVEQPATIESPLEPPRAAKTARSGGPEEVSDSTPVRASGFLGLSDDYMGTDEEENTDKRRWWQFWR